MSSADTRPVNTTLIGLGMIGLGVLTIVAAHREWGWYVNHYQLRSLHRSGGLLPYTYLMCSPAIGFGVYILVTGAPPFA